MKTDELFYELFKIDPRSLFRLVQLDLEGEYAFESITVKATEKRFDGFCRRVDAPGPNVFLEIQGYFDPLIYWRLFREICLYHEQTPTIAPFIAIVLFLDDKYDPKHPPFSCTPPHRLIRANLPECFAAVSENPGALAVLQPLVVDDVHEMAQQAKHWKITLQTLPMSARMKETLLELLEYLILQRFPKMTRKEIDMMLQLTPLEKTMAGQEVFLMGKQEGLFEGQEIGREQGIRHGEMIGEIRLAQRLLNKEVSSREMLSSRPLAELEILFKKLDAELKKTLLKETTAKE